MSPSPPPCALILRRAAVTVSRMRCSAKRSGAISVFTRVFDALWHRPGHSDFPVDSRNENLPEKCIHQNYASRPGRYAARDFRSAGAACLALRREQGEPNRPPSVSLAATDGCRKRRPAPGPCFGVVLATKTATSTCPRRVGLEPTGDRRPSCELSGGCPFGPNRE